MKLSSKALFGFECEPLLAILERRESGGCFTARNISDERAASLRIKVTDERYEPNCDEAILPANLGYLSEGDIVRLNPRRGEVRVLYRRSSHHNALFVTERCNSRCIMCPQPPRETDDSYLVDEIFKMLPWMAKDTPSLGITGGEPTLLQDRLLDVITMTKTELPNSALHMLSNGRFFAYQRYAQQIAGIDHPDFMVGIPLYSDIPPIHDFVVQAGGAFEQTVFGIQNLARVGVRIELRMVVHRETYARLPEFARFVARNLPFVEQVVIMGLEPIGYARSNIRALWIDPVDYQEELERCVTLLDSAGLCVSIYNHQLCVLRPSLHSFARKSISDWKSIYLSTCGPCLCRDDCGGFFKSVGRFCSHSEHIRPLYGPHD